MTDIFVFVNYTVKFLNRVLLNAPKLVVPPWFLAGAGMRCAAIARHWLVPSSRLHLTRQIWQRGDLKGSNLKGHDRTLKLDIVKDHKTSFVKIRETQAKAYLSLS